MTSEWTVAQPKNVGRANATTGAQQAEAEVESNYARKRKDGYLETVNKAQASTRFSPMLAKNYEDYQDVVPYPAAYVQPKLDGIRCIANAEGLWSRKGDRIVSCPHVVEELAPVFAAHPHLVFDGELYNHVLRADFNQIASLVKTTKPSLAHLEKTRDRVQYHIYDLFSPTHPGMVFSDRHDLLGALLEEVSSPDDHLVQVSTLQAADAYQVDSLYVHFLEQEYEGIMVRLDTPYQQKRTNALLKRKEFVDSEFKLLEIIEGNGNASGGAKAAWFELDTDPSKKFKADVVGTKAERVKILRNAKKLIGRMATVKYFAQRTPDGKPRFGKVKLIWDGDKW